jgi:hypothetical protein
MDQTQLIKALVKILREDIRKTLKEEIRNAVHEVLNEQVEQTSNKKVNESYEFKSKDDGSWGEINLAQPKRPARPMINPADLGYGDGFSEYTQPDNSWGSVNEGGLGQQSEYSSYLQGQEQGGIPLEHKVAMTARKNPDAAQSIMNAMTRDYSQLVKKFNKG